MKSMKMAAAKACGEMISNGVFSENERNGKAKREESWLRLKYHRKQ
jgi:hypothetical protein